MIRLARAVVLVAVGYLGGRAAAAFELDRRRPVDLRALADDVERRQWDSDSAFESLTSSRST